MLERLKSLFNAPRDALEEDQDNLPLAAAMLFLEVAWADHDISDEEIASVSRALGTLYALSEEEIADIVATARQRHTDATSMYPFTRTLNDTLDHEGRKRLIRELWRLALADTGMHKYEEHVIRRIADLLYVSHSDFIAAKLAAKE